MFRHGRLRNAGRGSKSVDSKFAFTAQSLEKCTTGRVAQGFENCGRFGAHLISRFAGHVSDKLRLDAGAAVIDIGPGVAVSGEHIQTITGWLYVVKLTFWPSREEDRSPSW